MSKTRIGIIGTGGMANDHANKYKEIRGVELDSCYDVDMDRARVFAGQHGVKNVAASIDQLLDTVDAVSIVTPDKFHVPLVIRTLEAGKHVLCEKPLALSLVEARKAARMAKTATAIHMINFSYRNAAAFHAAAKLVADGRLGEIRHVHARYLQHWLSSDQWGHWTNDGFLWRLQTQAGSGGVLGDVGCHLLDFITGIAGDLKAIACRLHTFKKIDPNTGRSITRYKGKMLDANDTALIELAFTNGAVGHADTTRWATGRANRVSCEIHGTEGAIAINLDVSTTQIQTCLAKAKDRAEWSIRTLQPTPNLQQRFIRSIKTGHNDQPDLLRGSQVQSYLDACTRSAQDDGKLTRIRSAG